MRHYANDEQVRDTKLIRARVRVILGKIRALTDTHFEKLTREETTTLLEAERIIQNRFNKER